MPEEYQLVPSLLKAAIFNIQPQGTHLLFRVTSDLTSSDLQI